MKVVWVYVGEDWCSACVEPLRCRVWTPKINGVRNVSPPRLCMSCRVRYEKQHSAKE